MIILFVVHQTWQRRHTLSADIDDMTFGVSYVNNKRSCASEQAPLRQSKVYCARDNVSDPFLALYTCKLIFFLCVLLFTDDDNIFEKGLATLGLGVVAIIGAAIGLVFLITIILCIVCCCCCGKSNDSNQKQYRAPPTPRPGSYPSHASNYSSYSSSASTTAGRPPYPMHYPPAYPPIQNGGYAVAYNQTNGRMEFPHKV